MLDFHQTLNIDPELRYIATNQLYNKCKPTHLFSRASDLPLATSLVPAELTFDHAEVFSGTSNEDSSVAPEVKKRKFSCGYEVDSAILKCLKGLEDKEPRMLDEEELFGMHIAAVLRRLTNRQKAIARLRIQKVLTDVEFPSLSNHV